jgi:hypothetical protein
MDALLEWGASGLNALARLAVQPFYYIGLLFVILQYRKQIRLERKLFAVRLHSVWGAVRRTVGAGIVAGLVASAAMAFIGTAIPPGAVVWLWVLSAALSLARVRFLCLSYAAGVLGWLHALFQAFPGLSASPGLAWATAPLKDLSVPSLFALVGVLHLLEAWFVRRQGASMAMPIFVESKRGKPVGGYLLQQFWPVPLFLLAPTAGDGGLMLPWTPLFGAAETDGWTLIPFPVILGYAESTVTQFPAQKARLSGARLFAFGLAAMALAVLTELWSAAIPVASLVLMALHEIVYRAGVRDERRRRPIFVHHPQGLTVLGVFPGSPAAEMGLEPGETIRKVNGVAVRTKEQLHEALQLNPAFCKLELIDTNGQNKFAQRAIFAGDHHQLGIILAPDDRVGHVLERREWSLATLLQNRATR